MLYFSKLKLIIIYFIIIFLSLFSLANFISNEDNYILSLMDGLLSNGQAGLIDLNLVKSQKLLSGSSGYMVAKDYSYFQLTARPRQGQSLEESKSLLLTELEKIKKGEFEDWMIPAVIKNFKLSDVSSNEYNSYRVRKMTNAFIMEQDWTDVVNENDNLSTLTKSQVVFAVVKHKSSQRDEVLVGEGVLETLP